MGLVLSRYRFAKTPTIAEIVERFHALTGLELLVSGDSYHRWDLSAPPLRDSAELARGGGGLHLTWDVGLLRGGYFVRAVKRTLIDLGGEGPGQSWPRDSLRRYDELSVLGRWWSR